MTQSMLRIIEKDVVRTEAQFRDRNSLHLVPGLNLLSEEESHS